MDLELFSKQLESMHERLTSFDLHPTGLEDARNRWEEVTTAFGTTLEEMRVAEEEIRQQTEELVETRHSAEAHRQRYQDLFDFAPDGYLVSDSLGIIREANRTAADLLGASPRSLVGKPMANQIAYEERPAFRLGLNRLLREGRRHDWGVRIQPRHGEPFDAMLTAAVVRDWDGSPLGLRWMFRKTEFTSRTVDPNRMPGGAPAEVARATADAGIAQSTAPIGGDAYYRELVQSLDVIIWEADPATGNCRFMSPRIADELGHPVEDWLNTPDFWSKVIHPEDRDLVASQRGRCLSQGQRRDYEYRLIARDGRTIWFRETVRHADGEAGRNRVLRGSMWNIGERKKAERELHIDRRQLLTQLDDLARLQDLSSQLVGAGDSALILGRILSAVLSIQKTDMGTVRLIDRDAGALEIVADAGLPAAYVEASRRLPIDSEACGQAARRLKPVVVEDAEIDPGFARWADRARLGGFRAVLSTPIVGRRGELLGTIATYFRDPRKAQVRQNRLVEQYARLAADAIVNTRSPAPRTAAVSRRNDEFLATLAHELRNPLTAIGNTAHLLRPGVIEGPDLDRCRDSIVRQVRHMGRLIEDLFDASRLSRGTIELRRCRVSFSEVVGIALESLERLFESRRHTLTVSLPEGPVLLDADPTRLEQVLVNLLTNSAKYTEPGGRIDLSGSVDGGSLVLVVRDNGIGMSPESLARVFDLFSQGDVEEDRRHGGLGIGLALVKSLVEAHGGTINARSEGPGMGSEFTVQLPIHPAPPAAG